MTYPIHPNNREGYNSSHKSWLRTDLPTSTPVSGFEDPAYPPDPSLSADTALWPLPELMMQPAFFFPDGGDFPSFEYISHFIATTDWPECDASMSQNDSPLRPMEGLLEQQPATGPPPAANYCSYSPSFTTGSTMSTASASLSDASNFSTAATPALRMAATSLLHPGPPPSNINLLMPSEECPQQQQQLRREYDMPNSYTNGKRDNAIYAPGPPTGELSEEQLLDAAIAAETRRQSVISTSSASSVSPTDSGKSHFFPPRPPLHATMTATTVKGMAPSTSKTPAGSDGANFETDPELIPRAYMRPNAVRASQACVACRKRKVRCVPLSNPPPSSDTTTSSSTGPWRKTREDGTGPIAGRCCRRCAKIGIECIWAKERRGKRPTPESATPPTAVPATDGRMSTSSTTGRPPIGAMIVGKSPSASSVLTKATTTSSPMQNTSSGYTSQLLHSATTLAPSHTSPSSSAAAGASSFGSYSAVAYR